MRQFAHLDAPLQLSTHAARVFISYARGVEPDAALALEIAAALGQQHIVFVDSSLPHAGWAARIDAELRQADVAIVLLSAQSIQSELVAAELATAARLAGTPAGRPTILPVRLADPAPLPYHVRTYLDGRVCVRWDTPNDTPGLIDELLQAIAGGAITTPNTTAPADTPAHLPPPAPTALVIATEKLRPVHRARFDCARLRRLQRA